MRRGLPALLLALLVCAPAEARVVAREGDFELRATERGGRGVQLVRRTGHPPCLTAFAADLPPRARVRAHAGYLRGAARAAGRRPQRARAQDPASRRGRLAWVAFLPDVGVRGLRSGRQRVVLDLPPAGSQCGYSADRAF
jgi:hypothetical protein